MSRRGATVCEGLWQKIDSIMEYDFVIECSPNADRFQEATAYTALQ
jgi:hypothetical protein